jgi:hypothetical protein
MKRSRTVFIDLLFLLLLTMLVTMIVKVEPRKSHIEHKAEFIIELTWDSDSKSDIDLWFREPGGNRISFQQKQRGIYHLARDDLGHHNDIIQLPDGTTKTIRINREILTMRGWTPGIYTINIFAYTVREPSISTRVIWYRLNPFKIILERDIVLTELGQEVTVASLTIDAKGNVTDMDFTPVPLAKTRPAY